MHLESSRAPGLNFRQRPKNPSPQPVGPGVGPGLLRGYLRPYSCWPESRLRGASVARQNGHGRISLQHADGMIGFLGDLLRNTGKQEEVIEDQGSSNSCSPWPSPPAHDGPRLPHASARLRGERHHGISHLHLRVAPPFAVLNRSDSLADFNFLAIPALPPYVKWIIPCNLK